MDMFLILTTVIGFKGDTPLSDITGALRGEISCFLCGRKIAMIFIFFRGLNAKFITRSEQMLMEDS